MSEQARITTSFDQNSTADDVIAGIDLTGKRVVVTGASSGLGAETARVLAGAGAEVTLAVRNVDTGRKVADAIGSAARVAALDLDDRASIDAFVRTWQGPLHILINNAGIMALPELRRTADGWEQQFATNHLGHFALTVGLHDALAAAHGARVVNVSSANHVSPVVFDDINFENRPYDPWSAYAQSKTANILMAVEAAKRWAGDNITVNAVEPGAIYETGLLRHVEVTPEFQKIVDATPWKTVPQGAATTVFAATSPLLEGVSGCYFEDSNEAVRSEEFGRGVSAHALDEVAARRLWDVSTRWLRG
ncbi:SDR family NAD(P)-dependent oxidoreductase [Actinoplanes sp. LDG1-06]|uniref:SDR family NAD(P)-dependent oxidoreductase n=1 Tax=Paractinoplanes ovalisporus TaxID=2810368 RepID=A0ABS2AJ33_9ACTN|nr:SDR family NAD(P)-dependent oxidoreductase [Actinoplanes ovalisporus]MBM2619831.1 SDR family NAD(P)-dependent oxidoreductase [Actinoplanes ovalisporus]